MRAMDKLKEGLESEFPGEYKDSRAIQSALKAISQAGGVISEGTERVMGIVDSLRSFARLDEAELQRIDIHEGLEDTLTLIQHELGDRVKVEKNFGDIPSIVCYPSRLNQLFLNILVNAAQAIEGRGEIIISTFQEKEKVCVAIKDTGVGIPEDHLGKVFDPGFTTKGVKVGTGLGLSLCYQIVQDHKGEISVESEVGKGIGGVRGAERGGGRGPAERAVRIPGGRRCRHPLDPAVRRQRG